MASWVWLLQGVSPTTIDATDTITFCGSGGFDTAITVGQYNDTTHCRSSVGADDSSGNTPNNVKYIASGTGDWGGGTEALTAILNSECTLKITFSDASSVATSSGLFYAYDGTTPATGPSNITVQAAESGDAAWTNAEGSGSAVSLTDQGAATDHDFYILVSCSPDTVGLKDETNFKFRAELTYT